MNDDYRQDRRLHEWQASYSATTALSFGIGVHKSKILVERADAFDCAYGQQWL